MQQLVFKIKKEKEVSVTQAAKLENAGIVSILQQSFKSVNL